LEIRRTRSQSNTSHTKTQANIINLGYHFWLPSWSGLLLATFAFAWPTRWGPIRFMALSRRCLALSASWLIRKLCTNTIKPGDPKPNQSDHPYPYDDDDEVRACRVISLCYANFFGWISSLIYSQQLEVVVGIALKISASSINEQFIIFLVRRKLLASGIRV